MLLQESTPAEHQRVFADIAQNHPDAIMVSDIGDLIPHRRLIVELVNEHRLPVIYGLREYVEVGGLIAYEVNFGEAARLIANDVHEILNGAKLGDIPIYEDTRFDLVIQPQSRQGDRPDPSASPARRGRRSHRMRRRDFTIGLLLSGAAAAARAQRPLKEHRIALVIPSGPVARIDDPQSRFYQAFWKELQLLGEVEGQNLTVYRYSAEGRPEGFADLAHRVVSQHPETIIASSDAIAKSVHAANGTIPIVWIGGDPIGAGLTTNWVRPDGNITGVTVNVGPGIFGKRLQILKEVVPFVSKVAFLEMGGSAAEAEQLREAGRRLQTSIIDVPLEAATMPDIQRALPQITAYQPDAVMVGSNSSLIPFRQLIVGLVAKGRLPAIYPWREYVEAGGLLAYASDLRELARRIADDVVQILNGAQPTDIPIYRPTKFELVVNLKAAKALGLTIPPTVLASADEIIE
jgi:putative tryptophan/tyrosine transport system substrate-binding protein